MTYQWGKPQLDEVENAKGASVPRRYVAEKTGQERKKNPPASAVIPPIIELMR